MSEISVRGVVGDAEIAFLTGKLALQADGSVVAVMGGTEVLATATATRKPREGADFFPRPSTSRSACTPPGRSPAPSSAARAGPRRRPFFPPG